MQSGHVTKSWAALMFCFPGKEVDQLIAAGYLDLCGDVAARLAAGNRVMAPVQLLEVAGQNVQLTRGLGGQVGLHQYLYIIMGKPRLP